MAKHLSIVAGTEPPSLTITVDGQVMTDVISYKMEGSCGRDTLTLVMEIMEDYNLGFGSPEEKRNSVKVDRGGRGTPQGGWKQLLTQFLSYLQSLLSRLSPKFLCRRATPLESEPCPGTRAPDRSCK